MHARPGQGHNTDIGKDSDIPIMGALDRGRLATPLQRMHSATLQRALFVSECMYVHNLSPVHKCPGARVWISLPQVHMRVCLPLRMGCH